jgi:hypothetical protein
MESADAESVEAGEIQATIKEDVPRSLSVAWATLSVNARKARYGVAYVRSICAQAGVTLNETSADEDVLAVDCDIKFVAGSVGVQVKCTSGLTIGGRSASWPTKQEWVRKWQDSRLPVYLVLVIVPPDAQNWIEHPPGGTFHLTAAFWRRIRPDETIGSRINIPKDQRFEASTLGQWHSDLIEGFAPTGSRT